MKLAVIDSLSGIEALRQRWDTLAGSAKHAGIFTSWMWQSSWWRHYGSSQRAHVITLEQDGELVGLIPLYVQRVRLFPGVHARVLRFIGTGGDTSPDYLDALILPGHEQRAAAVAARHLVREFHAWDVAQLTDMHGDSPFYAALRQGFADAQVDCTPTVSARISFIDLPATWDDYLAAQSRDRRYTVRNTRRKFEALPGARFFEWKDGATLDRAIDRLIELHHLRWQSKGEAHAFSSPTYIAFHREVMHAAAERGELRLYCMELEGSIVAMYYCYRYRDTVSYFQGGFDPAHERLRPGLCLMGYAIECAIGERSREFDMLRGEYAYKTQWAKGRRDTLGYDAYRPTTGAWAYRIRREWLPGLKRAILRRPVANVPTVPPTKKIPTSDNA